MRAPSMKAFLTLVTLLLTAALGPAAFAASEMAAPEPAGHAAHTDGAAHADDHGDAGHGGGHAEGPGLGPIPTHKEGIAPAITAIIVFLLVLALLSVAVWPQIQKGLDDRNNKIRSEIESAEAARAQAKAALDEYNRSLAQARAEAAKMLENTKSEQAALAAELKAKADRELSDMRDRAMRDIDAARKAALSDIYNESVALAGAMASKILKREVTVTDRDRLLEESLRELSSARN